MKKLDTLLAGLALFLIVFNLISQAGAWFVYGRDSWAAGSAFYFGGPPLILLAVWALARDRRTRLWLTLTAAALGVSSYICFNYQHNIGEFPPGLTGQVIFLQWLLAALSAVRPVPAPDPDPAPDLRFFKASVSILALAGLAVRLLIVGRLIWETAGSSYGPGPGTLLFQAVVFFLLPIWPLLAAGRRPGVCFAAGLIPLMPVLTLVWTFFGYPEATAVEANSPLLYTYDLTLILMTAMCLVTAVTALAALARPAKAAAGKPAGRFRMLAGLIGTGSLILALFLALGYHQGRRLPEAEAFAGPMKTVRFADMEIAVPAEFRPPHMVLSLALDGWRFRVIEADFDSEDYLRAEIGRRMKLKSGPDPLTLELSPEVESEGDGSPSDPDGLFKRGSWPVLIRDVSPETGRDSRLLVASEYVSPLDGQNSRPPTASDLASTEDSSKRPGLELTLFVRYGESGLLMLTMTQLYPEPSEPRRGGAPPPPPDKEFLEATVSGFLDRSRAFLQNYRRLEPEAVETAPGWRTRLGLLTAAPDEPSLNLNFRGKEPGVSLWIRMESRPEWRLWTGARPLPAAWIIDGYYCGLRQRYEPAAAAGQPGRFRIETGAGPGLFPPGSADGRTWINWTGDDQDGIIWDIDLWNSYQKSGGSATMGLGRSILNSFRRAGDQDFQGE